ncbi:MAG: hypothetical protein BMS9Abin34_371 [Patescibacteria group bacterium]|nr:MAG: hypothetical protein BMS9Abin34_371 [Patescibacteria group bacterium]
MSIVPLILGVAGVSLAGAVRATRATKKPVLGEHSEDGVLLEIRVPKGNEKDPLAAEQMFASLHGLLRAAPEKQERISFEIASDSSGIRFYVWCPQHLREFIEGQLYAQYPSAELKALEHDYMQADLSGLSFCGESLVLSKDSFFPIKTFRDFEVDPLAAITGAMSEVDEGERIWVQILVRPVPDVWQAAGHAYVKEVRTGVGKVRLGVSDLIGEVVGELGSLVPHAIGQLVNPEKQAAEAPRPGGPPPRQELPRLSAGKELELKMIEDKLTRMGFGVAIRVFTAALDSKNCQELLRGVSASFRQFSFANLNSFTKVAPSKEINSFKEEVAQR